MILGFTAKEIATAIAIAVMAAIQVCKWLKERRAIRLGLAPNPKRCTDHAKAINKLNDRIDSDILPDLQRIKEKLGIV